MESRMARVEQHNIEQDRRLKNLEHSNEALMELTLVTRELADTVKRLAEIQEKHDNRIASLELEPGKKILKLKDSAITNILMLAVGMLAGSIFDVLF